MTMTHPLDYGQVFGINDRSPLPPAAFHQQIYPTWARIYIELADELKEPSLSWRDLRIVNTFQRLAGFEPSSVEYADLETQSRALYMARETDRALYCADEEDQLDGMPAIDYAAGWMASLPFLKGLEGAKRPSAEYVREAAERSALVLGPQTIHAFISGFQKRVALEMSMPHREG